ncbi:MAG: tetratricopeptide repeat protein [Rubrivivax sp.]|nr:tetratricopeptide repeat protein [Rubrivivax sp.]
MAATVGAAVVVAAGAVRAAEPRTPAADAEVLERVPARASDPQARALVALRETWRRDPGDAAAALALVRHCLAMFASDGDPRRLGCAQAALGRWWALADPPVDIRIQRAVVLQFSHRFDAALADLDAALRADPQAHEAWLWRAAILMVQARYAEARQACERAAPLTTPLAGIGCRAQVDATTGAADAAVRALRTALAASEGSALASRAERAWVLTRLAETEDRRGNATTAEAAYREALAIDGRDFYLLAAYADFLLDQGRAADVLRLLAGRERVDVLLLRLGLAAERAHDPAAAAHRRELAARFDAARRLGEALHEKEEARFALAMLGDAKRALALARSNFAVQREPADARVLLEAALAARDKAAAQPALAWLAASGIEAPRLRALAAELEKLP